MQSASRRRAIKIALLTLTGVITLVTVGVELILLAYGGDKRHAPPPDSDLARYGLAAVLGSLSLALAIAYLSSKTRAPGIAASVCALLAVAAFVFALETPTFYP